MTPIGQAGSMLATSKKAEPLPCGRYSGEKEKSPFIDEAKKCLRRLLKIKITN